MSSTLSPLDGDPLWYKDAIIYELHVKSFFDSNNDGVGDFPGLTQKLDYLQDLGITAIWLLPFYPSPLRDDGYDIADYHGVHPKYGTVRDFRQFVREAHRRGIRVITELVINHTSDQHPWFQLARAAPPNSTKRNFYVWSNSDQKYSQARIIFTDTEKSNWTWDPMAKAYYWHRFFSHQPDLNFDNPVVRRALFGVMNYWFDMGVDGMRLDAVPYLVEREGTNCENLLETHAVLKELRQRVDARYQDRMLLAEANQWPTEVRPYFGDGDECHMAFHFPLMPRIFMALRQEDRHPVTEIMRQTPDIPENCQWALFLRNHDELTLEMVTDEERDYMYKEYAADPRARLNLGIRRRLAPLMENSRRRMELLNTLLLSFPGTPVIYYGDEIGMGDNFYLGDRNGVRTPMHWTGDRNAGFSRADPAQLYSPPIMDPVYGYQAINVEAQQRDSSSLLNWMKRMIALRKQFKTFGRGTLEFLHPKNRKVLAYVRRYQDEIMLAVANLSRFVQPVELELAAFAGLGPVEMLGRVEFPAIGEQPYFLSLAPHSSYWFQLQHATSQITLQTAPVPTAEKLPLVPVLPVTEGWETLLDGNARATIELTILPPFLERQRWFGAKARTLRTAHIADWSLLRREPPLTFLPLVEVEFADGETDFYFVPLGVATGPQADAIRQSAPRSVLARLVGPEGEALLHDAMANDAACETLLAAIEQHREIATRKGFIRGLPMAAFDEVRGGDGALLGVKRALAEQSNSSVLYGGRLFLKLFRRLQPGTNPDLEVSRFLTEKAHFNRIPRMVGAIEYLRPWSEPTTLAVLEGVVNNEGDGWTYTMDELHRYFERASTQTESAPASSLGVRSLIALTEVGVAPLVAETVGAYLKSAGTLGRRTAELHLALAHAHDEPAFVPEPLTADDLRALSHTMRRKARRSLAALERNFGRLGAPINEQARRLLSQRPELLDRLGKAAKMQITATKIRCHGDYHLGQVLWAENDFVIIDFEGEPDRPLSERRAKQSPLKDVASMLRSFGYATYAALFSYTQNRPDEFVRLEPWAKLWQMWTSAVFLREYRTTAAGASFLPEPSQFSELLELFILDKALYELLYELNNRAEWVRIPLRSILSSILPELTTDLEPPIAAISSDARS